MKFACVTPCLNAEKYIEQTLLSVLSQSVFDDLNNKLVYCIKDGGSTDKTKTIVKKIISAYANKSNLSIVWVSQPDSSMYEAIAHGFNLIEDANIFSYINADDYYSKYAFEIVAEIFKSYKKVHFLTGRNTCYNDKGHLINSILPYKYNKNLLKKGLYGDILPFVQQEAVFWDSAAQKKINFEKLTKFKYAGDYFMWLSMIEEHPLYIVNSWLGGFRIHNKQLTSQFIGEYKDEMKLICQPATLLDKFLAYLEKTIWYFPNGIKKSFNPHIFEYSHNDCKYRLTKRPT